MRDNCRICGAVIGENNHTGIGGGCMTNVVEPAKKDTFFKFRYLDVYIEQASIWRNAFLDKFSQTKFRSDFKKSFYESIKNNDRISKKQIEIIKNQLSYDFDLFSKTEQKTKNVFLTTLKCFAPSNEEEIIFYGEKIQSYKKAYLSNRKKTDVDQ